MITSARATLAIAGKDLCAARRRPLFPALVVVVSALFVGVYALVVQVSATTPAAVADGGGSEPLHAALADLDSVDGPMLELRTSEPAQARRLFEDGATNALLALPDLGEATGGDAPATLTLEVRNLNSDLVKNVELRAEQAVRDYATAHTDADLVTVHETPQFDADMRISTYLGTALLLFAVMFAATVGTGALTAAEWEQRTAKAAVLSPAGPLPLLAGKWLSGAAISAAALALVLPALAVVLDYPVTSLGLPALVGIGALWWYGAGIGALLGMLLRRSLPLVPVCVVISVLHLLISGYESYIRGFAHDGAVAALWRATHWWPTAALADQIRFDAAGTAVAVDWLATAGASTVATAAALAAVLLHRRLAFTHGQ
ncbi:ABC transporter permease [Egibacter rhizosphaerae]|uniref:ABC transporter permease n=1 Tax=Egibacter rhizosphaerae TaxID=1670831 RepID=A0A411YC48_9ACTN|nr:ABC transporter permease [Egibacter rhizosphaerae]QBI18811.1 ABC transporter permease [Egibacter rhizosphaerae]